MLIRSLLAVMAFLVLSTLPMSANAGELTGVCDDVVNSFTGELILDGFTTSWETTSEPSALGYFELLFRTCSGSTCSDDSAVVNPEGSETMGHDYEYEIMDPELGSTVTLEVWSTSSVRACAVDIVVE